MTPNLPIFSTDEISGILTRLADITPYFVQVGAMDGVSFDAIYPFISHYKWPGLLIEPMPDQFAALKENYLGHPGADFANVAIADYNGTITMRYLDPSFVADGRLPREALGMSTTSTNPNHFVPDVVRDELKPHLLAATRTIEVPCQTLQSLLDEKGIVRIDLLICDVEGADWMVLQQLDLSRYRPQVIFFEYDVLTPDELAACVKHFGDAGYIAKIETPPGQNMLLFRPQAAPIRFTM